MSEVNKERFKDINVSVSRWMKFQGITHQQAAEMLGVCVGAVHNQLSTRHFSKKMAARWSATFGLNERFLLTGKGPITTRQGSYRKVVKDNDDLIKVIALQKSLIVRQRNTIMFLETQLDALRTKAG